MKEILTLETLIAATNLGSTLFLSDQISVGVITLHLGLMKSQNASDSFICD